MSILKLFAAPFNAIIDSIGNAIDNNVTSDEERLTLQKEMLAIQSTMELELGKLEQQYEQELTKRHELDMTSDSRLSKNIRPMVLIYLLGLVTFLATADSIESINFTVAEMWIYMIGGMCGTAFTFYFGSRGAEKFAKIKYGQKN